MFRLLQKILRRGYKNLARRVCLKARWVSIVLEGEGKNTYSQQHHHPYIDLPPRIFSSSLIITKLMHISDWLGLLHQHSKLQTNELVGFKVYIAT